MSLITSQIFFAFSILILTIIAGLVVPRKIRGNPAWLTVAGAFSSGVFLSAALLHMLPEAVIGFQRCCPGDYPFAYLICVLTAILLFLTGQSFCMCGEGCNTQSQRAKMALMPCSLVGLLTIHSLIEGAAIGANENVFEALTIFLAVFAHKGSESFALSVNLHRYHLSERSILKIMVLFSLLTPLGILVASYVLSMSESGSGNMVMAILNAVTAGTFLYIGTEHLIEGKKSFQRVREMVALLLGVTVMAVVALFV